MALLACQNVSLKNDIDKDAARTSCSFKRYDRDGRRLKAERNRLPAAADARAAGFSRVRVRDRSFRLSGKVRYAPVLQ